MARTRAMKPATSGSTDIALIDSQLSQDAAALRSQIGAPSGNKIKIEPKGAFVLPEGTELGDEIQVVVVDFMNRNMYYSVPYTPNEVVPPDCYAFGRTIADLAPESDSPDRQSDNCAKCPMNAFGSARIGNGKACANRYWVAVLVIDPDNPDAHNEPDAPIYLLDLSPTNRRSFEGAIAHATRMLGHWVKASYTVTATNVGTYASVSWKDPVANPHYALHVARRAESEDMLTRRPDFTAAPAAPSNKSRAPARRPATKR